MRCLNKNHGLSGLCFYIFFINIPVVCPSVFPADNIEKQSSVLPKSVAKAEMCYFCFDVLHDRLHRQYGVRTPNFTNDAYPLFVTWEIGHKHELRGCIGTFEPVNLHMGLRDMALKSAMQDTRFKPITQKEFPWLTVTVSILRNFEKAKDYLDWELGHHGVRIEFFGEKGSARSATYLPMVPIESGWNKIQTINSLLRKGGYRGVITPEVRRSIKLEKYQADVVSASYNEYITRS